MLLKRCYCCGISALAYVQDTFWELIRENEILLLFDPLFEFTSRRKLDSLLRTKNRNFQATGHRI